MTEFGQPDPGGGNRRLTPRWSNGPMNLGDHSFRDLLIRGVVMGYAGCW